MTSSVPSASSDFANCGFDTDAKARRETTPQLAFIGRQEKWKGPDLFIELISSLPAKAYAGALMVGPSVRVGDVDSGKELSRMAERRRVGLQQVEFPRPVLWENLASQDWITVTPSRKDTFNLSALELLLCGTPTVISKCAGVSRFLEEVFPGLPYLSLDPEDLPAARAELLDLLRNYDARSAELARYLDAAKPRRSGSSLTDIYRLEPSPDLESRRALSELSERLGNCIDLHVGSIVRSEVRSGLLGRLDDIFAHRKSTIPQMLTVLFDQVVRVSEIAELTARQQRSGAGLSDLEFSALSGELAPFCFSGNRVPVYRLLAELEQRRGNDLLYATYQTRAIRLSGRGDPRLIEEVGEILTRHDFAEEAGVLRMLHGENVDHHGALAYLRAMRERFRTPPAEAFSESLDRRTLDQPKISIIVSLYNAADKLRAFLRGIQQLTETTRRHAELILIDSNSPDDTYNIVRSALDGALSATADELSTLYVRTRDRETIQRAWNRGITLARAPYLAFLGVDEMNRPDAFDILADYLDRHPAIDWVQGTALITDVNKIGSFVGDVMPYNRVFDNAVVHYLDTCYIGYVGALYRRSIHDTIGLYDDRFRAAGDTEFKNRALPEIGVTTIPECLGFFWNYPEARTTQSPAAEIEDLRAWYLYRSSAGMAYAFDGRDADDAVELFFKCLGYRKSYMDANCTDLALADTLYRYLEARSDSPLRRIMPFGVQARALLDAYRVIDDIGGLVARMRGAHAMHEVSGVIENAAYNMARAETSFSFLDCRTTFDFTNDNRSHQHHLIWPSRTTNLAKTAPAGEAAGLRREPNGNGRAEASAAEAYGVGDAELQLETASHGSTTGERKRSLFGFQSRARNRRRVPEFIAVGDAARDTRDWVAAAAAYRKALDVDPGLSAIWVQLGHALKEQGDRAGGEAAYRRSIQLAAEVPDTHLQLGHVLKLQGRKLEAANAYFKALMLDPQLQGARRELMALGYTRNQIAGALGDGILPFGR